jgi:hypothetical protein
MKKAHFAALALVVVFAQLLGAQNAKTVIANASKAMGIDGVNSIGCGYFRTKANLHKMSYLA